MSAPKPNKGTRPPTAPERRFMLRYPSTAGAEVIRESDVMRCGYEATLRNVSLAGLGLWLDMPLNINEQVKVRVRNDVQRIEKEMRGVVRHVTPRENFSYLIGIELHSRLTPLEVQLLRMGIPRDGDDAGPLWV